MRGTVRLQIGTRGTQEAGPLDGDRSDALVRKVGTAQVNSGECGVSPDCATFRGACDWGCGPGSWAPGALSAASDAEAS